MKQDKIGVAITTYNSEDYFKSLYESLPLNKIDELVVINGGNRYKENYSCNWIQHKNNYYPSVCRNDGINFLLNRDCEWIIIIEDDMIIKNQNIFNAYINASKKTGIKYFSFTSMSWESGEIGNRTPRLTVNYDENTSICFYKNTCNEFTLHHKSCFKTVGLYDTQFRDPFDIDLIYRESKENYCPPFWYFPDIKNSDDYIMNNPNATSRLQSSNHPDGSREERIQQQWQLFYKKHGLYVNQIPDTPQQEVIDKLKRIKP